MGIVVRRYIDSLTIIIHFPYSTCINSFFGSNIPTSLFIFKMFFRSCLCYFFTIYKQTLLKEHSRSFKKIARPNPETSTCEVPRDVSM